MKLELHQAPHSDHSQHRKKGRLNRRHWMQKHRADNADKHLHAHATHHSERIQNITMNLSSSTSPNPVDKILSGRERRRNFDRMEISVYAGAKFIDPPSPNLLPLPPYNWRVDASVESMKYECSTEVANFLRDVLRVQ